ncbi:MAG: alpha-glucosidase, partial [Thermoleophilia bacterium]|nr:alpha-glucosidase [Thermoleophilia bacterium]
RDGCRVPIPWSHAAPGAGFAIEPDTARAPWMWQPDGWAAYAEDAQEGEPTSMLELYRAALHARRDLAALQGDAGLAWLEAPSDVLAFTRGDDFACVVNVAAEPAALPPGFEPVLASAPLTAEDRLPSDAAVWLVRSGSRAQ